VDLKSLESVGVSALEKAVLACDVVVIDEIGKMELCSAAFRETLLRVIESEKRVLGTVMLRSHPWVDAIKARREVKLVELTRENRGGVETDVMEWLAVGGADGCTTGGVSHGV
jgi:nucleoside-triphosphatase THEP1